MPWIAAGGAIIGGLLSSGASGKAADAQTQASQQAIAEQRREFLATQAANAPFQQTGTAANRRLATLLGISGASDYMSNPGWSAAWHQQTDPTGLYVNPDDPNYQTYQDNAVRTLQGQGVQAANASDPEYGSLNRNFTAQDLQNDPVYNSGLQFGLDQGSGAINARALAGGGYDSGATLKALTRFGNDYGSTKANDSFNRFNTNKLNTFNMLSGISGTGQTAVNQVSSAGQNMANNVGNLQTGIGNANAASIVGGANAWGNAFSGAANSYQNNKILQALMKNQGGGTNYSATNYGFDPNAFSGDIGSYYPS